MASWIGKSLGRYQIVDLLGEGGMASVYRAYDTRLGRYVALKVMRPAVGPDSALLRRFELEARALAQLSHPAVVRVLDYGEQDGQPYLVLEFIPSGTLKDRLSAGGGRPEPWREAVSFLLPIARALEAAHQRGIIHRDVKPGNILIAENGQPMLSDFGIAKTLENDVTPELTGVGMRLGTPEYMSPEQCNGAAVDYRTDIYSLGLVLYEMLTGRKAFTAETPMAVMQRQVYDALPPPRQFAPGMPRSLEAVLYRALDKDPGQRFATMGEFAQALERVLHEGDAPRRPGGAARRPAGKRSWRWLWGLVLGLAALLGLVALAALARPVFENLLAGPAATPRPTRAAAATDWQQGRLAYIQRQGGINAVYLMPLKGEREGRLLYAADGRQAFGAAWSPDGEQIAFYVYPEDLRVLNVNEEDSSRLIGRCNVPAWSPQGDRIICREANRARFQVYDAGGGGLLDEFDFAGGAVPAWSPVDANQIAFSVFSGDRTSLWRMSLESRSAEPLAEEASENYAPAWSPDGGQIAYQSNLDSANSEIWVMNSDGGGARRVTNSPQGSWSRAPSWSPDGQWLAFVSSQAGSIGPDYGEIFVVSLQSGEVIQVTQTGGRVYDWRVSWSE